MERIGDFLAWLGGADKTILKQVPSERIRFIQMAGVLLTTASIAVLSMMFALHDGLKLPWLPAVFVAIFWGIVILNLDRFLVLSMGATRDRGRLLLMAAPRLLMAIVLALVISTPLVLRIFSSDINARVYVMQLERSKQQKALEVQSKEQQEVNRLTSQIDADQAVLDGRLPGTVTSPALQAAQAKVTALQKQEAAAQHTASVAYAAWVCELYGHRCHGASGVAGNGNLAVIKQQQWQKDAAAATSIKNQLTAAMAAENTAANSVTNSKKADLAQAQRQARAQLPGLKQQRAKLLAFISNEENHGTALNQADTGILTQIQALYSIGAQDSALAVAHWAVFALFFIIEILPVLVKFLLNLGPMSAYEIVAGLKEDELIDAARARRTEARRVEEGKSRTRIKVEDDMRSKEEDLGKRANDHVAGEMTKILDIALQEWSTRVQTRLSNASQSQASGPQGQPGNGPLGQPGNGAAQATSFFLPDSDNL